MSRVAGIMAGGLGSRLRSLGTNKALVRVGGVSLIDHVLNQLRDARVDEVFVELRDEDAALKRHLNSSGGFSKGIHPVVTNPRGGTGSSVRGLLSRIEDRDCLISTVDTVAPRLAYSALWDDAANSERSTLCIVLGTTYVHDDTPIWIKPAQDGRHVLDFGKEIPATGICFGNVRWLSAEAIPVLLEVEQSQPESDVVLMRHLLRTKPSSMQFSTIDPIFDVDDPTDVIEAENWLSEI